MGPYMKNVLSEVYLWKKLVKIKIKKITQGKKRLMRGPVGQLGPFRFAQEARPIGAS
jgi:hypothetical protein